MQHPHAQMLVTPGRGGTPESRRRPQDPPKLTMHSTETPPGTGRSVGRRLQYPYTLIADPYRFELFQLLPGLDWTAWSLRGTHADTGAKIETNHSGRMHPQVSLVGYAADLGELPENSLNWIADIVLAPVMEMCDIPNNWLPTYGPEDGIVLARADSPVRLTLEDCWAFNGVMWHQVWHGNDHWDAGKVAWQYLEARLNGNAMPLPPPIDPPQGSNVILGLGDTGPEVAAHQMKLNRWFNAELAVDGDFGPLTEQATRDAQATIGAEVDGYWGPQSEAQFKIWKRKVGQAIIDGLRPGDTAAPAPEPEPAPSPPPEEPAPPAGTLDREAVIAAVDKIGADLNEIVGATDDLLRVLRQ